MKKNLVERLAWFSIFASLLPVAEARIGETKAECVARYGEVQPPQQFISISGLEEAVADHTGETSSQKPDDFLSFRKAGFEIVVGFKEDRAVLLQYYPDDREQNVSKETGVPPKFDPIVMRGFVGVSGWFRCLAERRP
jgi:hypothetical protein